MISDSMPLIWHCPCKGTINSLERGNDFGSHDRLAPRPAPEFLRTAWPFGDPTPRIYFDKRTLTTGPPWSSLHAKCVVVDGERAFLSSANFSVRAQEHNIEAGVLLHDPAFALHLARQWLGLIEADLVVEAPTIGR